jgi:integrase
MVQLQLLTGMRPGELVILRAIDLDTAGKVWLYRPGSDQGAEGAHKTAHRGHRRIIPIGPRGQEILRRYLKPDLYAHLFSPWEVVERLHADRRQRRKTKVQPSQARRTRKRHPRRKPRDRYSVASYGRAIARAVLAANTTKTCETCKGRKPEDCCAACQSAAVPHWHPHQLRHTKATEIRREAGLDAARAVLGHRSPVMTEVYAELDMAKAAEVMERLG